MIAVVEIRTAPRLRFRPGELPILSIASAIVGASYVQFLSLTKPEEHVLRDDLKPYETQGTLLAMEHLDWNPEKVQTTVEEALLQLFSFWRSNKVTTVLTFHKSEFDELKQTCNRLDLKMPKVEYMETLSILRRPENTGRRSLKVLCGIHLPEKSFSFNSASGSVTAQTTLIESFVDKGYITMPTHENALCSVATLDDISKAFIECDVDRNGEITKEEFRRWYESKWDVEFKCADVNDDERISFEEFEDWYKAKWPNATKARA